MYKKIRFYLRFTGALLKKYYPTIILGLVLGITSFIILPQLISRLPKFRSVKREAVVGRYTLTNLPLSVQEKISIGLTSLDISGRVSPALATSWQATDSGKTYIFTLNPNINWQDGTSVRSQDIKYHFRDAIIDYPDSSHLVIRLQDSFSPLPSVVAKPIFKVTSPSGLFGQSKYIGLGSYRIQSYRKNGNYLESLVLSPLKNLSSLPELHYVFYPSETQARTAYKLGLVDSIENLQEIGDLQNWPNVKIIPRVTYDRYIAVFFNTQDAMLSGSSGKNLRLALAYAIDKSRWPNRAIGPISPLSWAANPDIKKYDQDLERAVALLGKVEKKPEQLSISTVPAYLGVADAVKKDWENLGFKAQVTVSPDIPTDFQILVMAQSVPLDPDQYNLWHSTQESANLSRLKNPRIDKLLEDGRKTLDLSARKTIYQDFQKYLLEEAPAVFLYYPQDYLLTRN
jgi:peptide/nickel transport system substrate-binding protein